MNAVRVSREYLPYDVHTAGKHIKDHHDSIFDGIDKPLCRAMVETNGASVPGCEEAAAYTAWSVKLSSPLLYDSKGRKKTDVHVSCFIRTALPKWSKIDETSDAEREEVRRFEMRTAYHERGHGLAGEHVAHTITRFLHELPARVSPKQATAMNHAVGTFIKAFYISMAQAADVYYDAATGHGLTQGAEAKNSVHD
jgi:hypothetical protein